MVMENFDSAIAEILEVDKVSPGDKLVSFECWDSLTLLSIIALTDQNYNVSLSANDVIKSSTIGGLKELIKSKMK
jgi:acyl carrier protein